MSTRYHHNVSEDTMLTAARALLKFCRNHQYVEAGLVHLQGCVTALEVDDFMTALTHFGRMSFGGMGRFDDWFPPVIYDHEDRDYVAAVFEALVERFYRLFRTAAGHSA